MKNGFFLDKFFKTLFLVFFFSFITACQTTPVLTADQKRALQTRVFSKASYNTVFRAFKSVMQDEGYIIKNQDFQGGLIVAESNKENNNKSQVFLGIAVGIAGALSNPSPSYQNRNSDYQTGQSFSWSVNLEEIKKNMVEARLILQRKDFYSRGGQRGREVLEPQIYRSIFTKVSREIQRRQALKRK